MEWIDIAGRWLILCLGIGVSAVLVAYTWDWAIKTVLDVFRLTEGVLEYARERNLYHRWKEETNIKE